MFPRFSGDRVGYEFAFRSDIEFFRVKRLLLVESVKLEKTLIDQLLGVLLVLSLVKHDF